MRFIKIYDKSQSPLTAFLDGEFSALDYRTAKHEIGDASFTLDLSNVKVTAANLQHYNRVEIIEGNLDGPTGVRWSGFIIRKQISLNVVNVRCLGTIGVLKKRLVPAAYTLSGDAGVAVSTMLAALNATDPTGITFGTETLSNTINMTFDQQDAFSVLKSIADASAAQFEVTPDRLLNIKPTIGTDLSASVVFRYNVNQIDLSNILSFAVEDNGDDIRTKAYGKSNALVSTQSSSPLQTKYGVIETFQNYRVANVQADVDALTTAELRDSGFSPTIDLNPKIADNFEVGDVVRVQVLNKLINIDSTYQILEKRVAILGSEKKISVKINSLSQSIINEFADVKARVALMETKV